MLLMKGASWSVSGSYSSGSNSASTRTTQLYDRRPHEVTFDKVDRAGIDRVPISLHKPDLSRVSNDALKLTLFVCFRLFRPIIYVSVQLLNPFPRNHPFPLEFTAKLGNLLHIASNIIRNATRYKALFRGRRPYRTNNFDLFFGIFLFEGSSIVTLQIVAVIYTNRHDLSPDS